MYRVTIYNDSIVTVIHEVSVDPAAPHLYSCTLTQGSPGEIDSLQFIILPNNPGYDLLESRTTLIEVLNTKTDVIEFSGRVLTMTPEMQGSGTIYKTVVCEDRLGYLCDSIQPYMAETTLYDGDTTAVEQFLTILLDNHNDQVEDYKKIYPGNVTFTHSVNNITESLAFDTTWSAITSKLLTGLGGEIQLREGDDGLLYLDYVARLGDQYDSPTIEFAKNMRSITREVDPTSVITRLIPLGAKLEDSSGSSTDESLTIADANNGVIYLDDENAQETYGIVVGTVEWSDVDDAETLLTKGTQWLQSQAITNNVTISAYDLSLIGLEDDAIERYNYYHIINDWIGINSYYRVIKRTVDICDPSNITYEFGERAKSLGSTIISTQQTAKEEETERAAAIKRLETKLDSSSGIYITEEEQDDGSVIYYMHNKPTLAESDIVWKMTAEAFGISTDGGQTYPYGFTVTGEVIAERLYSVGIDADYIATGSLTIKKSGTTIFEADVDAGTIMINTSGLKLTTGGSATFAGALNAATGTFKGTLSAAGGTFTGTLNGADGTFSGELSAATGTFSGDLEAAGGTFSGTLNGVDGTFTGELSAATGTFSGDITAATGTFSGTIKAASGSTIGGWTIGSTSIYRSSGSITCYLAGAGSSGSYFLAVSSGGSQTCVVYQNGNIYGQTITAGSKFSGELEGNAATATKLQTGAVLEIGSASRTLYGNDTNSFTLADIGAAASSHTHTDLNGYVKATSTSFLPVSDNTMVLGYTTYRWSAVYSVTGTIQTSDRNEKREIRDIAKPYEGLFMRLQPRTYMWRNFQPEDNHDRVHCGLIAQEVETACAEVGLDSTTFAALCRDDLDTPTVDGRTERYSINYGELHGLEIHMIQKNVYRLDSAESEIAALKAKVAEQDAIIKKLQAAA